MGSSGVAFLAPVSAQPAMAAGGCVARCVRPCLLALAFALGTLSADWLKVVMVVELEFLCQGNLQQLVCAQVTTS